MIEDEIKKRAKSYTPEWRYDATNPDIGAAVAKVFAKMMERSGKKLSMLPVKNRIAFLNSLGADLLPAVCAEGYVVFGLVNQEVEGTEVPAGTRIIAYDEDEEDGQVVFETLDPVYATPARMSDLYYANDRLDVIYSLFDTQTGFEATRLFPKSGENLQAHELYISHDILLALTREAEITVEFPLDGSRIEAAYSTETGWEPFAGVVSDGRKLILRKEGSRPAICAGEVHGQTAHWLRFTLPRMQADEDIVSSYPTMSVSAPSVEPDVVYGSDAEQPVHRFLPFGERLDEYSEVYFGSEERFSKRGARTVFSFRVDFIQIPLDTDDQDTINWEWIMERSEFRPVEEYDVSIASVIWEYFNGYGWTTLKTEEDATRVFSYREDKKGSFVSISFQCPQDIAEVMVGGIETYYIRARIRKVNNLYKLRGQYIIPVMENVGIRFNYETPLPAQQVQCFNNVSWKSFRQERDGVIRPYEQMRQKDAALYIGFEASPVGYPIQVYLEIANEADRRMQLLSWEYWNGSDWMRMHPVDGTSHFSRSGFITLTIRPGIKAATLFGKERYWLKVTDTAGVYETEYVDCPILNRIFINAVRVRQINRREQEYFRMEAYQKGTAFTLLAGNIQSEEVFVEETGQLSERERRKLLEEHRILEESDGADGKRIWVKWQPVDDFYGSGARDRHYVMHRRQGRLQFGDGWRGRIPAASVRQNIFIRYSTGGGKIGNRSIGDLEQVERSIGFINSVTNPAVTTGGSDEETLQEAIFRFTGKLRHQNRAVSERDYVMMAYRASRDVLQARAFGGIDENGQPSPGHVTLVILDRAYPEGQYNFGKLKNRVLDYFRDRINPVILGSGHFTVTGPELVEMSVYAEIVAQEHADVFSIRRNVADRIERFLRPREGSEEAGWQIGSLPSQPQLVNVVMGVEGIRHIRHLAMVFSYYGSQQRIDIQQMRRRAFVLPVSGNHEIIVTMS